MEERAVTLEEERRVFRVSELTRLIRELLEDEFPFLWVEGEVSNCKLSANGHLYFTLKDEGASLRAVCFRQHRLGLRFELRNGLHVLCFGRLSVYEPRGEYQLLAQLVEPVGYGALQLALEQLKKRLAQRGFFDPARKRPLPFWPRLVGVVTSLKGAAIRDFLRVALKRNPGARILVYPVRVQGEGASYEIAEGIRVLSRYPGVEVLVVTRGGGSFEDLFPFNEEPVAQAVFDSPVPVVSAVGHEIDVTICDLVADLRVPTPTAAAHVVFPEVSEIRERIFRHERNLREAMERRLRASSETLSHLLKRLKDPRRRLLEARKRHEELSRRLVFAVMRQLETRKARLSSLARHLEALSPLSVLARGYSIVRGPRGEIVKEAARLAPGETVEILFARGKVLARVEEIEE